ncbi:TerD family protein [Salinarimonas sp. NSM]|uniref:TerD family protein n=1 Tax=Salinarimonas sp. NSM TaxID=3458003 RepID=UPI004037577A
MTQLTKGANAPVNASAPVVRVRFAPSGAVAEIDVSAFLLQGSGKVSGDADMVFYGQPEGPGGAVRLTAQNVPADGGAKETTFAVALGAMPAGVEKVAVTATIHGAGRGVSFSQVASLEVAVLDGGSPVVTYPVDTAGMVETALILGELYLRNGQWKFRAVGQGFAGGLKPLAESFGVSVDGEPEPAPPPPPAPAARPPSVPRVGAPSPGKSDAASAAAPSINLSKVTLTKERKSIDLSKKAAGGYGEVRINLNWNRNQAPPSGGGGFFGFGKPKGVDLDLGCLFELADGRKGAVQALGDSFGYFDGPPYVQLSADDRTGQSADGEWLRINGRHWDEIRRVLVYAFIYEGAPNWAATDGVVTVFAPDQPPVEVRLDETSNMGMCAVTLVENVGGQMRVSREVKYFQNHKPMDEAYGWGMRWTRGSK